MTLRSIVAVLSIASILGVTAASRASSPEICAPTTSIDRYRLLRQISLDLRGRIPTIDEYRGLDDLADVPDQLVEEMLESEEFYATMREYHRALLWPTLDNQGELAIGWSMGPYGGAGDIWYNSGRAAILRGKPIGCLNTPHTQFDAAGLPVPTLDFSAGCPASGCRQDGYVMVEPYWAPGTQIKVCAFDAQTNATGLSGACAPSSDNSRARQSFASSFFDQGCGCGPNLQWCIGGTNGYPDGYGSDYAMRSALKEEPLRIFDAVIRENRSYFDALSTKETYVNGPSIHFQRYIGGFFYVREGRLGALPAIPFSDRTFVRQEREGMHSGVLTTLAYLIRFTTNRARADRFYSSFLCKPFVAPVGGLPPATDPCSSEPNLSERCGCATCHSTLEPAASHWGRWESTEFFGYLDPSRYTPTRADCATCAAGQCPEECTMYYVTNDIVTTDKERPYLGMLKALEWRSPQEQAAVDQGPAAMVAANLASGDLARCSARTMAENMLQRNLTADESLEWIPQLAAEFAASNYNFKELIRKVVYSDRYRQIH